MIESESVQTRSHASPEDGADLKDALEISADRHLFVQLWGLREAGGDPLVVQPEDGGSALARAGDQLGGVDLLEVHTQQEVLEQLQSRRHGFGGQGVIGLYKM